MRNGHLKWRCAAGVLGKGATQGHGHIYRYPLSIACCNCLQQKLVVAVPSNSNLDGSSLWVVQAAATCFIWR